MSTVSPALVLPSRLRNILSSFTPRTLGDNARHAVEYSWPRANSQSQPMSPRPTEE
jgi:hypothetical protein